MLYTEAEWETPPDLAALKGRVTPRPLALRWETRGETAGGFESINRAANWTEFLAGVRRFSAPSQNFVYADVDGHIGYAMSGRVPLRSGGDGGTPSRGWTGEQDWVGTAPAERLPAVLDPPSGQVVTANAEIDPRWPGVMTRDWTAPFRTMRIAERLAGQTTLDQAALSAIQMDVRSAAADPILAAVEAAAKSPGFAKADDDARVGIDRLRLWDRQVDGRPVVTLYEAFVRALWRRTFADELNAAVFKELFEYGASERYVGLYAVIDDPASRWWNDIATIDRRESRDDIVLLAAADAVIQLRTTFGQEANWAWDRVHSVTFRHALGAGGFALELVLQPRPGAAARRLVDGAQGVGERPRAVQRRRPGLVSPGARRRQLGSVAGGEHHRPVRTSAQPALLRSERPVEHRPLPHRALLARRGGEGAREPDAADAVVIGHGRDARS